MKENNSILWFKNDLRLLDNESLIKSISQSNAVLPIFIIDPRHFKSEEFAFAKAGINRFHFLVQTLQNLRENLKSIGGNLYVTIGKPEIILPQLSKDYNIDTIYAEEEYAYEEIELVNNVLDLLPNDTSMHFTWGKTMYHKDDLPYKISEIPMTSKAFRINTEKVASVRPLFEKPKDMNLIEVEDWGTIPQPSELGLKSSHNLLEEPFLRGGETAALERLAYYTVGSELLTSYKWNRNKSLGLDYSSKLSPYLALGAISPRKIYYAVKDYEKNIKRNISTWWLVFEVVWRDFFTFKGMKMGTAIFKTDGYSKKEVEFTNDELLFEKWCQGQTGIPFIDAHMRQLNQTGYMSNRGRVNCASYFVHDLKIDWTWGAAYFESKLIDYDVSANWMNWHMQAYEIWYTNPVHQSLKYKSKEYLKRWIPELSHIDDAYIFAPWLLEISPKDYPTPIEVYTKWTRSINNILKEVNA